jgi:hypothetical protein
LVPTFFTAVILLEEPRPPREEVIMSVPRHDQHDSLELPAALHSPRLVSRPEVVQGSLLGCAQAPDKVIPRQRTVELPF